MATKLENRLVRLRLRKSDLDRGIIYTRDSLKKAEQQFDYPRQALEYISASMEEVDPEYTRKTYEECDRVESQLQEAFSANGLSIDFRHQGSVTNNTHIRIHSDIDLLTLTKKFYGRKSPLKVFSPYQGDPVEDLKQIRRITELRLNSSYPQADVDTSGSKAVSISGGSLKRKIDVVSSNWLDTEDYVLTDEEDFRGIEILDLGPPAKRIENFPFHHNLALHQKEGPTAGGFKRLVRFCKSAKADADQMPDVSSYDITALCWNIPNSTYLNCINKDFELAFEFVEFCRNLLNNDSLRESLWVPNGTRKVFGEGGTKMRDVIALCDEILGILSQAVKSKSLST